MEVFILMVKKLTPLEISIELIKFANKEGSKYVDELIHSDEVTLHEALKACRSVTAEEILGICDVAKEQYGSNYLEKIYSLRDAQFELQYAIDYIKSYVQDVRKTALDVAVEMKVANKSLNQIMEATGLSEDEIASAYNSYLNEKEQERTYYRNNDRIMWEHDMATVLENARKISYKSGYTEGAMQKSKELFCIMEERIRSIMERLSQSGLAVKEIAEYLSLPHNVVLDVLSASVTRNKNPDWAISEIPPAHIALEFIKFANREESDYIELLMQEKEGYIYAALRKMACVTGKDLLMERNGYYKSVKSKALDRITDEASARQELEGVHKFIDGWVKGKNEVAYEIARRLKTQNIAIDEVMRMTGLSLFEVKML